MPREPRCSQAELGKSLESSLNRKRQAFWKTREVRGPTHSWNLNFSITSLLQPSPTGAAPLGGPRAWWRAAVQGRGRSRGHESGGSVAADSPGGVCGVDRRRGGRVVCVPGPPVPGGEPDACGVPSAGCGLRAQSPAPGGGAQRREAERGHRAPRGRREERAWSPRDPPTPSGPPGPLLPTWSSHACMGPCPPSGPLPLWGPDSPPAARPEAKVRPGPAPRSPGAPGPLGPSQQGVHVAALCAGCSSRAGLCQTRRCPRGRRWPRRVPTPVPRGALGGPWGWAPLSLCRLGGSPALLPGGQRGSLSPRPRPTSRCRQQRCLGPSSSERPCSKQREGASSPESPGTPTCSPSPPGGRLGPSGLPAEGDPAVA